MINNLASISKTYAASTISGLSSKETKEMKEKLDGLFAAGVQFYNTGSADVNKDSIKVQIELLEAGIDTKKDKIDNIINSKIQPITDMIEDQRVQLIAELNAVDGLIKNASQTQNDKMKVIIDDVMKSYIRGDIKENEIGDAIGNKLRAGSISDLSAVIIQSKMLPLFNGKVSRFYLFYILRKKVYYGSCKY